jgi:hypothetical protein
MIIKAVWIWFVGSLFFTLGSVCAQPQINYGRWEFQTNTQIGPGYSGKVDTYTQCISETHMIPFIKEINEACKETDILPNGNSVVWKFSCDGQGDIMKGGGSIVYNDDTMRGVIVYRRHSGSNVRISIKGKRIGNCDGPAIGTTRN